MKSRQQIAHTRIQSDLATSRAERNNPKHRLMSASTLETFNPPISKSQPLPPDPALKARVQHGSPRKQSR